MEKERENIKKNLSFESNSSQDPEANHRIKSKGHMRSGAGGSPHQPGYTMIPRPPRTSASRPAVHHPVQVHQPGYHQQMSPGRSTPDMPSRPMPPLPTNARNAINLLPPDFGIPPDVGAQVEVTHTSSLPPSPSSTPHTGLPPHSTPPPGLPPPSTPPPGLAPTSCFGASTCLPPPQMVPPVYQLSTLTTESFHDAPAQEFPPPPDGLPSPRPGPPLPLLPFNIAPHNFFPFLPPSSGGGAGTVYRFPYHLLPPGGLSCAPGVLPCGPGGQATSYLPFLPVVTQPLSLPFPTLPHQTNCDIPSGDGGGSSTSGGAGEVVWSPPGGGGAEPVVWPPGGLLPHPWCRGQDTLRRESELDAAMTLSQLSAGATHPHT